MERDAFPVSVSLERYFSDERARCLMWCSPRRHAGWLSRRLRRTFALPERPALTCRGHLLPPGEPLALLQPEDTIEAIPSTARVVDLSSQREARESKRRRYVSPEPSELPGLNELPSLRGPASLPSSPSSPPAAPRRASPPPCLEEMKRRALELLESHESRAPRRRRRVRRRRNAAPHAALGPEDEEEVEPEAESVGEVEMEADAKMDAATEAGVEVETEMKAAAELLGIMEVKAGIAVEAETEVVRNEGCRRAARCVRALDSAHH